jgi:hypothetical protein
MNEEEIEKIYNRILKRIEKNVIRHNGTTLMSELNKIGREVMGIKFKGVFPSDKIPKLNELRPYCILNLDKSSESGSHWIAIVKDKNEIICYDSFGRKAKKIIPSLFYSGNGKVINTDLDKEQHILETNCGQRCLSFLIFYDRYGKEKSLMI